MPKSSAFQNDILKLIFNGTAISNVADNAATAPLTGLFLSLHTADPGLAGTQATSEVAYTGYARVAVVRTTAGWTVTGNSLSPVVGIEFPEMTAGTNGVATHASIGVASTGASKILYSGALTPTIAYAQGVTPRIKTTSTITES